MAADPCGDTLDASYDDESGPFTIKRLCEKSEMVDIGAPFFSRGFGGDVGGPRDAVSYTHLTLPTICSV
eukprot:4005461-Alexandrium_andersonii.AAC.1